MGMFMQLVLFADVLMHVHSDTHACPELRLCQVHAVPSWQRIKLEQSSTRRLSGLLSINPASSAQGIILRPACVSKQRKRAWETLVSPSSFVIQALTAFVGLRLARRVLVFDLLSSLICLYRQYLTSSI